MLRSRTRDGEETTVYLVRHPLATTRVAVRHFPETARLDEWCSATGHAEAMVAGFFVRDPYRSLVDSSGARRMLGWQPVHTWRVVSRADAPR